MKIHTPMHTLIMTMKTRSTMEVQRYITLFLLFKVEANLVGVKSHQMLYSYSQFYLKLSHMFELKNVD